MKASARGVGGSVKTPSRVADILASATVIGRPLAVPNTKSSTAAAAAASTLVSSPRRRSRSIIFAGPLPGLAKTCDTGALDLRASRPESSSRSHSAAPHPTSRKGQIYAAESKLAQLGGGGEDPERRAGAASGRHVLSHVTTEEALPVTERVVNKTCRKSKKFDLRAMDGKCTRQVEQDGTVVERRFTVLWDERHAITKDQLTKDHMVTKISTEERERLCPRRLIHEEVVEKRHSVPVIQRTETIIKPKQAAKAP